MRVSLPLFPPKSSWVRPSELPDLSRVKVLGLDCETKDPLLQEKGPGYIRRDGYVCGISVSTDGGFTGYLPLRHPDSDNMDPGRVYAWLRPALESPEVTVIGANIMYDLGWLRSEGCFNNLRCRVVDVQTAEALLDEERDSYSLDSLAKSYLGQYKEEVLLREAATAYGFGKNNTTIKSNLWQLPAKYVGPYGEADARLPRDIFTIQRPALDAEELLGAFDLEMRIIPLLLEMKFLGVRVDLDKAEQLSREWKKKEREYEQILNGIDPASSTELARYCRKHGYDFETTAKGNPSFEGDWLRAHPDEVLSAAGNWRTYNKLRKDFIDSMVLDFHVHGRIHSEFNPVKRDDTGTRSFRFSSTNPNLQNVPARNEDLAPLVRGLFIPEHGGRWCRLDYSQQEPRVLTHYAYLRGFKGAAEAAEKYRSDPRTDFHQLVADMAGITRKQAKGLNLGMIYGMGVPKMADKLGISLAEAEPLFKQYHQKLPFVKDMADDAMAVVARRGYIRGLLGHRRHFKFWEPADKKRNEYAKAYTREEAEKQYPGRPLKRAYAHKALNSLVQGSSAGMTKKAMLDIWENERYVPHIQVHDELDFTVDSDAMAMRIKHMMENCVKLEIPILADTTLGNNWGECK